MVAMLEVMAEDIELMLDPRIISLVNIWILEQSKCFTGDRGECDWEFSKGTEFVRDTLEDIRVVESLPWELSELSTRSIGDNDLGGFKLFIEIDRCGRGRVFDSFVLRESLVVAGRSVFCLVAGFNFGIFLNVTGFGFGGGGCSCGVSVDFFTVVVVVVVIVVVVIEMELSDDFFSIDFDEALEDSRLIDLSLFFVSTVDLTTGVLTSFFGVTVVVDFFGVIVTVDLKYSI